MPLTATIQIMAADALDSMASRAERRVVASESTLRLVASGAHDVTVEDLSTTGCLLRSPIGMALGTRFRLGLRGGGAVEGEVIRIASGSYGCAFPTPIPPAVFAASFGADTVRPLFAAPPSHAVPDEIDIERWPRPVRAMTLVVGMVATWGVVGAIALYINA